MINKNIKADIIVDNSVIIEQRIALLTKNGVIGFVLVLLVLTLFLHPSLAGWVAVAIPISFSGMFILASLYGVTLNVISLFGMIIVIGILVDDGIIIGENIFPKNNPNLNQNLFRGDKSLELSSPKTKKIKDVISDQVLIVASFKRGNKAIIKKTIKNTIPNDLFELMQI